MENIKVEVDAIYRIKVFKDGLEFPTHAIYASMYDEEIEAPKLVDGEKVIAYFPDKFVQVTKIYEDSVKAKDVVTGAEYNIQTSRLEYPQLYTRYSFNPGIWQSKANLTVAEVKTEIETKIEEAFASAEIQELVFAAPYDGFGPSSKKILGAIKRMLAPFFGSFLLALLVGFIRSKIEKKLQNNTKSNDKAIKVGPSSPASKGY